MPDTPPTTIAAVSYLNSVPLIHSLDKWADCQLTTAAPAQIAPMVLSNQADLGLISLIDAARHKDQLALVPCSMIGCDGPTLTVRLVSKVTPPSITTVHADTESHTSVVLADLILREQHATAASFVECDINSTPLDAPNAPETILMIGDKVITNAPNENDYPYQIDLGQAWKTMTGLPFVYAVWMCKADRADDPRIHLAAAMLERVHHRNRLRLDHIVSTHAHARGWPTDLAKQYIGEFLRFKVDQRARDAAELFLSKAADAGIVDHLTPRWVNYAPAAVN